MAFMNHQQLSLLLYLEFLPPSNKLGINPCLKVDANINMIYLASTYIPGNNNNPLKAMKVSLPYIY